MIFYNSNEALKEYKRIEDLLSHYENLIEKYNDNKQFDLAETYINKYNTYIDKLEYISQEYSRLSRMETISNDSRNL